MNPKTILVVDDADEILYLLKTRLNHHGYHVETAQNGQDGYDKAVSLKPDLIMTDILMPLMAGFQMLEALHKHSAEFSKVPVIFFSAKNSMANYFTPSKTTFFMNKPLDMPLVIKTIDNAFGVRSVIPAAEESKNNPPVPGDLPVNAGAKPGGVKIQEVKKSEVQHEGLRTEFAKKPEPAGQKSKTIMIVSVDEFLTDKLIKHLRGQGYTVEEFLDEQDVLKNVNKINPQMVLCQYWEDGARLDAAQLMKSMKTKAPSTPFVLFSAEGLSLDALKIVNASSLITFKESSDLIRHADEYLKKNGV
ncbi:MAG: hypothetical protein A2Z83_04055 [Omnitrophica bacterium GWA2_52_8]|nr:MAG: hypothetical protein A2Z83_04055 [Omnitrophica bacterium GWA2_52_8]